MSNKIDNKEENNLQLIPKCELFIQYSLEMLNKLPRIEKFNIRRDLIMEINAETLYKTALEEVMFLKKQVIELKALYLETKEELDKLKNNN